MRNVASLQRTRTRLAGRSVLAGTLVCLFGVCLFGCAGEPLGPCDPDPTPGKLGTICGFHDPEDVEVVASLGVLVVSEMSHVDEQPGSLAAVDLRSNTLKHSPLWPDASAPTESALVPARPRPSWLDADCNTPPETARFSPHGIGARDSGDGHALLAVVSHGAREAIEVFALRRPRGKRLGATWLGCLRLPPRTIANDVILGHQGTVLTTRYRPSATPAAAAYYSVVAGLGGDTGEVLQKRPGEPWQPVANSNGATPNGLLESADAVYFAQTGPGSISAIYPDGRRRDIPVDGHPDNLAWAPDGTIQVVSHTQGLRFVLCSLGKRPCRTAWSLFEIDPETLRVRLRLRHDGSTVGAAASVAEHEGLLFFGSVFGDRIGVLRERSDR